MKEKGLYVHIPFCARKCNYCDFTSYVPIKNEIDFKIIIFIYVVIFIILFKKEIKNLEKNV